jgi:ribosomal-protein-alanine N-acetyltransferase
MSETRRFTLDTMKASDVPAVARLEGEAFPTANADLGSPAGREQRLSAELERPWAQLWVARDAGRGPIGYALAWLVADEVHLLNVATHPSARRMGVGGSLVEAVVSYARRSRAVHVRLELRRSNEGALRMYRRAGFFVAALRRDYYPDREDAIDMDLQLDPATGEVVRRADEEAV